MQVTPAIFPKSFDEIIDNLNALNYAASMVQIDFCDGEFGLLKTWLPESGENLPADYDYEFDIMMNDWKKYVKKSIDLGAARIVAHVDHFSEGDAHELIALMEHTGIALGISVSNNIPLEDHINFIKFFEEGYGNVFVQVMGIAKIGAQGQPFDETVLQRIQEIKEWCPNLYLQVDGAMNNINAEKVKEAGADIVISGSYIFGSEDVVKAVQTLEEI
jgi:ribulose-phosphate 3-epimerase